MPQPNRCQICGEPHHRPIDMCRACSRAYDRDAHEDSTVMFALLWAARRARWYAERKAARLARARLTTRRGRQ